jgi:hypothetical protein
MVECGKAVSDACRVHALLPDSVMRLSHLCCCLILNCPQFFVWHAGAVVTDRLDVLLRTSAFLSTTGSCGCALQPLSHPLSVWMSAVLSRVYPALQMSSRLCVLLEFYQYNALGLVHLHNGGCSWSCGSGWALVSVYPD